MTRAPKIPKTTENQVPPYPHPKNPKLTVILAYKRSDGPVYESEQEALQEQAEIDEHTANRGFLPWEYCECGCKGHELNVGRDNYWCYTRLKNPTRFHLHAGHGGTGRLLGVFKSWKGVDAALAPLLRVAAEKYNSDTKEVMEKIETWEKTRTK